MQIQKQLMRVRSLTLMPILVLLLLSACHQIKPRKIEVLFLGHNQTHHDSEKYLPMLASALTPKGINFTYTADPNDLNHENLAQFDGLILYANHDSITPPQEKALLDFVRNGKGFIPVHCASYCFRNSDEVVALIGGQFKSHETGIFTTSVIHEDHPITFGFQPFKTWDETYVHDLHTPDKTVLMERVAGDHREPWTWVKKYGRGRVFYTAYGHDERTWDNPGFHDLMERGIRWAVGDALSEGLDELTFPEMVYEEAVLPNYEKRDPPPMLQAPLDPGASQQMIQVPPGFELQLFAAEPDIGAPISCNWDEKGRLWLLETQDYPNEINIEEGQGNDRITILEDTDGDGRADQFKVFADNLSVPTSLVFYDGGVIVSQAPHFLFLKDTDGDDRADVREIIMSGWGTFDTHAGPSNLQYGFDNWIWGTVGYSAFNGKVGEDSLAFRQGVYRFKPDGSKMEFMGSTTNNTWGLGFSETFDVFISTANNTHSAYLGIPEPYQVGVADMSHQSVKKIESHYSFHPITKNVRQVDVFGGFTAAAGHHLYTARSFPQSYWNRIAFVCEPTGHLMHRAVLERDGAGYKELDGWNMLASADEWVSPVHAEVGPDGALWFLDWYNFIIQHNPTPDGFENGKGNAHINPHRDDEHGRIYRLVYKDGQPSKQVALSKDNPDVLLQQLKNDNLLWRMHAQRLLVERRNTDVKPDLLALLQDQRVDQIGLNSPIVHVLWTLKGLGLVDAAHDDVLKAIYPLLSHQAAGVRKAAIQVLPATEASFLAMNNARSFQDEDLNTRLQAFIALGQLPTSDEIGALLYQLNEENINRKDEWLAKALYLANVKHRASLIPVLAEQNNALIQSSGKQGANKVAYLATQMDTTAWGEINVPGEWSDTGIDALQGFDGVVWHRIHFELTPNQANQKAVLHLGKIDDGDDTYVNGQKVGGMVNAWQIDRFYPVSKGTLKAGDNWIAIRVVDQSGGGGLISPAETIYLQLGKEKIPLAGKWWYHIEETYRKSGNIFSGGQTPMTLMLKNYPPNEDQLKKVQLMEEDKQNVDQVIVLKTIKDQMKYDQELITVRAGSTVEIIFENNDAMQHNLVIIEPDMLESFGKAADVLATKPGGADQHYVPALSYVLASTAMLNPGNKASLRFQVPDQTGDYPFVCTFPAHWRTMNGIMKVVNKPL